MARQCERPGCCAPAEVAYGMSRSQLLVWLEMVAGDGPQGRTGAVCRRHADAMVVPRGWSLDDRRESRPRLFRVSDDPPTGRVRALRGVQRRSAGTDSTEQLSLSIGVEKATSRPAPDETYVLAGAETLLADEVTVGEIRPLGRSVDHETQAMPWRFEYDDSDDLGGLLKTDSPLLSRAFRGQPRTD